MLTELLFPQVAKPSGQMWIRSPRELWKTTLFGKGSCRELQGVGWKTGKKFTERRIQCIASLRYMSRRQLVSVAGKTAGRHIWWLLRGLPGAPPAKGTPWNRTKGNREGQGKSGSADVDAAEYELPAAGVLFKLDPLTTHPLPSALSSVCNFGVRPKVSLLPLCRS